MALRCTAKAKSGPENGYTGTDFHFMIQQSNGNWSDKHSTTNTVHYNHSNISSTFAWSNSYPNKDDKYYDSKVLYFAVCNKKPN